MKQYRKWAMTGVALMITGALAGCNTASSETTAATNTTNTSTTNLTNTAATQNLENTNNATSGVKITISNQTAQNTTSTNQTTNNTTQLGPTASAGRVHLNLTNAQIKMIEAAVKKLNGNPTALTFGNGIKVYVPNQVPQGQQLLNADCGGDVVFGTYVTLYFSGFAVTLGSQHPSQLAIRKSNSVKLSNGTTGTWYVSDSTTAGTTYYFMTSIGKTYISFYSNLKTVSQARIEQTAGTMVLGASQ